MKKGEKIFIVGLIVVGIILLGIIWAKNNKKNNESTNNNQLQTQNTTSQNETQDSTEENKIEEFKEEGGITRLTADVENPSNTKTKKKNVKVKVLDEKGSKITELKGIIDPIEAKGKVQLNMGVTIDVSNAYDFEISEE